MKFSAASAVLFAGVAFGAMHGGGSPAEAQPSPETSAMPTSEAAQGYTTVEVTEYTTYCPEATTITHSGSTIPIETPGIVTLSGGPYTVTRPLLTSTITKCKACSSETAAPTWAPSSAPVIPTSAPVIPAGPSGVDAQGSMAPSSATPSPPVFTGGANKAAAGGAAVAGLFGVVAALL